MLFKAVEELFKDLGLKFNSLSRLGLRERLRGEGDKRKWHIR
jgi:hypothetical protein